MRSPVDLRLRDEAARFHLRFACDHCAHWDRARAECVHRYPPLLDVALDGESIAFCKEFELGEGEP